MDTFGRYVRKPCQGDLKGVLKMESILTQEQIDSLSEAIQIIADAIAEMSHRLANLAANLAANVVVLSWDDLILNSGIGKIKHLALHAKKKRIRKKNFHRLQKMFLKLWVTDKMVKGNT